ncbi:MAG TPA: hypothetical protein VHF06_10600 [Pseudonocardiaceae bacterium]|nr:hypothetical protein [Pseudonocardiaceae bacterium]
MATLPMVALPIGSLLTGPAPIAGQSVSRIVYIGQRGVARPDGTAYLDTLEAGTSLSATAGYHERSAHPEQCRPDGCSRGAPSGM